MKKIPLTGSDKFVLVNDEDHELLSRFKWQLDANGYARATVRLHRLVNQTPLGMQVDHINHDKLDNRKENLRNVTNLENSQNRVKRGCISFISTRNKWSAKINHYGKRFWLGDFSTKEEASNKLKNHLKEYYGSNINS